MVRSVVFCFLSFILACGGSVTDGTQTTTTTTVVTPDDIAVEVTALAGDVDVANATVKVRLGQEVLAGELYSEYVKSPFAYDRNDGPFTGDLSVGVFLDGYYSVEETVSYDEIAAASDHVTVEIPLARDLRGSDWSCLQQWIVDGVPTDPKETEVGAVELEKSEDGPWFTMQIVMWGQVFSIIGDTIYGEKDIVIYSGVAESNDDFNVFREAKEKPNNGAQFVCTR
jgi:transcription elongation GreA/GreB family factor